MPNVYDTFAITVHRIELTIINNTIMYPSKFNSTVSWNIFKGYSRSIEQCIRVGLSHKIIKSMKGRRYVGTLLRSRIIWKTYCIG